MRPAVNRHEFEAETVIDIARFILAVFNSQLDDPRGAFMRPCIHQPNHGGRVFVSFESRLNQGAIRHAMENVPDYHVMMETLR